MVAGDVSVDGLGLDDDGRALLATCTTVIHSAARVSFDSPLDAAVEVNLVGPLRVLEAVRDGAAATGRRPPTSSPCPPPTWPAAAGAWPPEAPLSETPFSTEVDWRNEVAAARRTRADADAESRRPELLARFTKEARDELGAAGPPLLAAKAEKRREAWLSDRMVEAGRQRAKALGWPDAYAYTKALAERAVHETKGDVPVSVVRPSIIESALAEPSPGLDPGLPHGGAGDHLLRPGPAQGVPRHPRGHHRRHPRRPGGGRHHRRGRRRPRARRATGVFQVATGNRNPLRYRMLVDLVREYFQANPLYDTHGQPIVVAAVAVLPPGTGPEAARAGHQDAGHGREGGQQPAHPGREGRGHRPPRGAPRRWASGPSTTSASTAPTPRPRPSSTTAACGPCGTTPRRRRPGRLLLRHHRHRLAALRAGGPHALGGEAGPGAHHRRRPGGAVPLRAGQAVGPLPRPPHRRLRPGEHPHRVQRGGELLVAGHPPQARRGPARLRHEDAVARRPGCCRSTARTGATSSATSTAATRTPPPTSSGRTPSSCSATCC